jgi:hypothetical protein
MRTGLEQIYIGLDVGVPGALLRIVLGTLFVLAIGVVCPGTGIWTMGACLLGTLFAIKLFAGVARRAVSASTFVRSHWDWRRNLARYYDSYQWRKLLWFGTGIILGGALRWQASSSPWILGVACVAAGGTAEMLWRRHHLGLAPPAS